jgi:hypothetical protein
MTDTIMAVGPTATSLSTARRADRADEFRASHEPSSIAAARASDATGFDLLFAVMRNAPVTSRYDALPSPPASSRTEPAGSLSCDGARAVESASYAARWDFTRDTGDASRPARARLVTPTSVDRVSSRSTPADEAREADRSRAVHERRETREAYERREADEAREADRADRASSPEASSPEASSPEASSPEASSPEASSRADDVRPRDELLAHPSALVLPAIVPLPAAPAPVVPPVVPPVATASHDAALASIQPELRDRLERVIARMQSEGGHVVRVVEGRRSQARQDALFAQGRTAPGPVVTWTRDSAHRDGAAVDVMINGGYHDAAAFSTLARIAAAEGLRTLGPRDPGHLELANAPAADPASGMTAQQSALAVVARVASPAVVAAPAAVATLASVARVAAPGGRSAAGGATRDQPPAQDRQRIEDLAARLAPPLAPSSALEDGATVPVGPPRVDVAARLEAVARIRDAQASQPLSRLMMDVPDEVGGVDRITVSLRGQRVDASLAIQDPVTASRVADRVARLAEALGARGYEAGTLSVTTARGIASESLDLARLGAQALEREGTRGVAAVLQDVAGGGLRERQAAPGRQEDPSTPSREHDRRSGDTPRRQSRRDPGDR